MRGLKQIRLRLMVCVAREDGARLSSQQKEEAHQGGGEGR